MPGFKRISLLLENEYGAERDVSLGISRYARDSKKEWHLMTAQGNTPEAFQNLAAWNADGMIGFAPTQKAVDEALKLSLPFVNLCTRRTFRNGQQVGPDHRALGRMAAEHLLSIGFKNLAFVTLANAGFSDFRREGFQETAMKHNRSVCALSTSERPLEDSEFLKKLADIKKPVALCCSNDALARGVLRACRELRISTPEQVAVLGINNNPILCETGIVSISSVSWSAKQVVYEAARILDGLINKKRPTRAPVLLPPTEVVARHSTDVFAIDDELVVRTLRFIHENAKDRIRISDIVKNAGVSRRNLETRFRVVMNRGLHDEVRRTQIERAKKALRETDWPMERVAEESGLGGGVHLGLEFKKHMGVSPGAYRKTFKSEK